jgi:hypothetical protein
MYKLLSLVWVWGLYTARAHTLNRATLAGKHLALEEQPLSEALSALHLEGWSDPGTHINN